MIIVITFVQIIPVMGVSTLCKQYKRLGLSYASDHLQLMGNNMIRPVIECGALSRQNVKNWLTHLEMCFTQVIWKTVLCFIWYFSFEQCTSNIVIYKRIPLLYHNFGHMAYHVPVTRTWMIFIPDNLEPVL